MVFFHFAISWKDSRDLSKAEQNSSGWQNFNANSIRLLWSPDSNTYVRLEILIKF